MTLKAKTLISIVGPTAAGKTALSVRLAQELQAPIISADSVQVYRGLDIGSGKVITEEMGEVPHYLLDVMDPDAEFSAGKYGRAVEELLPDLFAESDTVLLVGGSGFYFQAVWDGFDAMPKVEAAVREQLNAEFAAGGLARLQEELERVDPETWGQIDQRNPVRIIRALEVWRSSGQPISAFRKRAVQPEKPYREIRVGLELERQALYRRIEARVVQMMAAGWLEEVRRVGERWGMECKGLQALGYRELVSHLKGEYDLDMAVELIQRHTRRYAKRQMTWFKRYPEIAWFAPDDHAEVWAYISKNLP